MSSLNLLAALHDESLVDVGNDTTTGNGSLDKSVKFLVTADGQLQVTGCDTLNLQVLASVSVELENLSGEVLKDRGGVDSRSSTNTAVRANSRLQESVNSSNRELNKKEKDVRDEASKFCYST